MSIPARTNAYGDREYKASLSWHRKHYYNGILVENQNGVETPTEHRCHRANHSKNPLRLLPDSTTLWRDPAPYSRGVSNENRGMSVWTKDEGNGHTWDSLNFNGPDGSFTDGLSPNGAFYFNGPYIAWDDYLVAESVTKAINRLKDKKAGMGENLAQASQTYTMLADSSMTLLRACLAVKRGNIQGAWNILKDGRSVVRRGADLLLQYKYGWKPLMGDIYGLVDLLKEQVKPALLLSATASSQRQSISMRPVRADWAQGKGFRQAQTKLYGRVSNNTSRLIDRVGLSNPLSLAWELVPFSFVVDWILPVGPVLDAMIPPAGVDFVGGYTTMRGEFSGQSGLRANSGYVGPDRINSRSGFSVTRRVYTTWPKAGLYNVNPFTHSHGLSAFALIIQQLFR